jgi:hypothetical protein
MWKADKPPIEFVVGDYCADKDCGSDKNCCTRNAAKSKGAPFLLDMDSRAIKKIWGISNPENQFAYPVTFQLVGTVNARTEWPKLGAIWDG